MKTGSEAAGFRWLEWLDTPPVEPSERIHLRALQGVQLSILLLFVLSEVAGRSAGMDRLGNVVAALGTLSSFLLLRRGRFRLSVKVLLVVFVGGMTIAIVSTGLEAQREAMKYLVLPQLLAGLLLGSRALWSVTGLLVAALAGATAVDLARSSELLVESASVPWWLLSSNVIFAVLLALLIDRIGTVLRRNLSLALERQEELEEVQGRLLTRKGEIEELYRRLERSYEDTLRSLSAALDLRDRETQGHSARVVGYSMLLGETIGLDEQSLRHLHWGALLHDIGKIAVPDAILGKKGPLSDDEWSVIRRHPEQGYEMLREVSFLRDALEVILCHHERWDGRGYPQGLEADSIPQLARIFSVVDTYDAMASARPYRAALPEIDVLRELREVAGEQLDPEIVEAFLQLPTGELEVVREMARREVDLA